MAPQKSCKTSGRAVVTFYRRGKVRDCIRLTVRRHGPGHPDFSMAERKDFSTVRERHRTFSRRIESREDKDEERHERDTRSARLVNQQAEACDQQTPSHVRESEEQQTPPAEVVDRPDGRPGEDEIRQTEAPGEQEGVRFVETCGREDCGAVEGYYVREL